MNIFKTFTRRCLWENRTRTIVTIIGIVLSMSLFTAVLEGAYSGVRFLIRSVIETVGDWHCVHLGLDSKQLEELKSDTDLSWYGELGIVGFGPIGSDNEYKPYIMVENLTEDMKSHLAIKLVQGRFAKTPDEIVISEHMKTNGNVKLKVGDTFTVKLGRRYNSRFTLYPDMGLWEDEIIEDTQEYTFTIVGLCERVDDLVESYTCPGYSAFTTGHDEFTETNLFIKLKDASKIYDYMSKDEYIRSKINATLLAYMGVTKSYTLNRMIYRFGTILCILISFGAISLIYNSFSISVSERIKMFGILKSVGATKRQLKYSVLYEALILSLIAIPIGLVIGCIGIGITLWCLRDSFAAIIDNGIYTQMRLELNPIILLIAILVCLITTFISALIPAIKVEKLSALESIKLTEHIKISSNDVKIPGIISKLFGFPGMMAAKNFKRNRKRYRSVVISLTVSVVLYVSSISFCNEIKRNLVIVTGEGNKPDFTYTSENLSCDEIIEISKGFSSIAGIKQVSFFYEYGSFFKADADNLYETYDKEAIVINEEDNTAQGYMYLAFVDDKSFDEYCKAEGLNSALFYDPQSPKCIVYNDTISYFEHEDGASYTYEGPLFSKNVINNTIYWDYYIALDENELSDEDNKSVEIDAAIDTNEELKINEEFEEIFIPMTVGALAINPIFPFDYNSPAIIYPISLMEKVLGEYYNEFSSYVGFAMKAKNPKVTYERVKKYVRESGLEIGMLNNNSQHMTSRKVLATVVTVFSLGFVTLISLICIANVFNTISTNVMLRRREFAMLKSVGMTPKGFNRMMNYECAIFGIKSILWGTPIILFVSIIIYSITSSAIVTFYRAPIKAYLTMIVFVFTIVFATMIYSTNKIKEKNLIDELKNENI